MRIQGILLSYNILIELYAMINEFTFYSLFTYRSYRYRKLEYTKELQDYPIYSEDILLFLF